MRTFVSVDCCLQETDILLPRYVDSRWQQCACTEKSAENIVDILRDVDSVTTAVGILPVSLVNCTILTTYKACKLKYQVILSGEFNFIVGF
jgi:hypothetical protein